MAVNQFCVKGATVTLGSDSSAGVIVSEITIGGGEVEKTVVSAMDGSNFTCLGNQADFDVSFDMIMTNIKPAQYIYGSGSTLGTATTVVFNNTGTQEMDITVDLGTNDAGASLVYTFSGCQAVNGIPKFTLGGAATMSLSFSVNPDNISAVYDTNA